jgi:TatD DNase family protein
MSPAAQYFDAHSHLQDDRFAGRQETILRTAAEVGVARMVVNGACAADWPAVAALAKNHLDLVQPSFGWHPWYLDERGPDWENALARQLDAHPDAFVGEIGLDRWMLDNPGRWRALLASAGQSKEAPPSLAEQEAAFVAQLRLAAGRNLSVSIHCLAAFGRLRELLAAHPRPARGFLLHSYGGPAEMIAAFAHLGGYFSFSGHFLHERKARQRDVFRAIPPNRLLVETDAPDQLPPDSAMPHRLQDTAGRPLNHPANLPAIYGGLAAVLGQPVGTLAERVAENFTRLFGTRFL